MATDPVCGMQVDEKAATAKSKFNDKIVYFCCSHCKDRFDKDPSTFRVLDT